MSRKRRTRKGVDRLITREQAAAELGVDVSTVRRMEGRELHPVKGRDGVHRFDPAEVVAVAARRGRPPRVAEGALAAMMFERFKAGMTIEAIVIELRQSPEVVRRFYTEWKTTLEEGYARHRRELALALQKRQQEIELAEERERRRRERHESAQLHR